MRSLELRRAGQTKILKISSFLRKCDFRSCVVVVVVFVVVIVDVVVYLPGYY